MGTVRDAAVVAGEQRGTAVGRVEAHGRRGTAAVGVRGEAHRVEAHERAGGCLHAVVGVVDPAQRSVRAVVIRQISDRERAR